MRFLGLDVGTKGIGCAISDEQGVIAAPHQVLPRHGGQRDVEAVARLMNDVGAEAIVLGLPRELSGDEGPTARRVRRFGQQLAAQIGCPVHYWDERFSTVEAERALIDADLSRRRRAKVVDQVAAALILQGFLDAEKAHRVAAKQGDNR